MTGDLASIGEAENFLVVFVNAPLTFSFGMVFLYNILGWRWVPIIRGNEMLNLISKTVLSLD